jgi:hypothetical protein
VGEEWGEGPKGGEGAYQVVGSKKVHSIRYSEAERPISHEFIGLEGVQKTVGLARKVLYLAFDVGVSKR